MLQQFLIAEGGLWTTAATPPNSLLSRAEALIAEEFSVSLAQLHSRTRGLARVARTRQVVMYLAHVALGFSLSALARHFRRDRTTVTHACNVIEDARDEKTFDDLLSRLEQKLLALAPAARA